MCGIIAAIGHRSKVTEENVDVALEEMKHRGEDNRGIEQLDDDFSERRAILGHNRLAINDLSSNGNQPFVHLGVTLICNGEIWNSPELRERYKDKYAPYFSTSDNEVIIYAFLEDELHLLDGMFSFILEHEGRIFVARDWMGKMPLYYACKHLVKNIHYMFASEIKGIQKLTALGRYKKNTIRLLHKNMIMVLEWKRTDYQVDYVARGESVRYHKMEEQDSEEFFINSNYTDYDTEKYNTFYHEWQDNYLDISADEAAKKTLEKKWKK